MLKLNGYLGCIALLLCGALLAGCASTPAIDEARYHRTPEPKAVDIARDKGAQVVWGGVIIATRNLAKGSQMEVLAFPLDSQQRPRVDAKDQGRFLLRTTDFIDAVVYAPGRLVTIAGTIVDSTEGKLGETTYRYPVVHGDQLHLWSRGNSSEPRFTFGIGISIGH